MGITIKKHRRNLSYEDAATLSEFWEIAAQFDRSFYRELIDRWDERGYDEYIVAAKGRLPYCESPEEYVCRMETRSCAATSSFRSAASAIWRVRSKASFSAV